MATTMTKKTTKSEVAEEVTTATVEKKKYEKDDLIPCKSITTGKLFVVGGKTGTMYRWADYGEIEYVEYQDLMYMIRSNDPYTFYPRFIVEDEDIVANNKKLKDLYDSMYTYSDLAEILSLSPSRMKKAIEQLPNGAKDTIKGLVATGIDNGTFDSIQKIKVIDEIFDTQLLMTLVNN